MTDSEKHEYITEQKLMFDHPKHPTPLPEREPNYLWPMAGFIFLAAVCLWLALK